MMDDDLPSTAAEDVAAGLNNLPLTAMKDTPTGLARSGGMFSVVVVGAVMAAS